MKKFFSLLLIGLFALPYIAHAEPAVEALGGDFSFPEKVNGLPQKLSDFQDLEINSFTTSDNVRLSYWEAGNGNPLVILPGWSSNGAEFINVLYLLSQNYHVYVLDYRNHGLSQTVDYGNRISRYATDVKELTAHLGLKSASYGGWSMGAAVLWSYIDIYGTGGMEKLFLIDEAPSIYVHSDWSEEERLNAGAFVTDIEKTTEEYANLYSDKGSSSPLKEPMADKSSAAFVNSMALSGKVVTYDPDYLRLVMFDHLGNDWRDVIEHKINIPTAIFTGEGSGWLPSQRWVQSVIPNAELHIFSNNEHGDHFLALKNPFKFAKDLTVFLEKQYVTVKVPHAKF